QPSLESGMPLECPMRHERSKSHRAVDGDPVEAWDPMKADDVAWMQLAAPHLDHEIGAAGEEPAVGAAGGAQLECLAERSGLVVVEAHVGPGEGAHILNHLARTLSSALAWIPLDFVFAPMKPCRSPARSSTDPTQPKGGPACQPSVTETHPILL